MKNGGSIPARIVAALLALLLVVCGVACASVPAASDTSEEDEDVSVSSVMVNINTETDIVFTELILHNSGEENAALTFPLPEISAGINVDTLTVKTNEGRAIEAPDGVVSMKIDSGAYAVLSYTYRPKMVLRNQKVVGFNLQQLSNQFCDRIGHLEWTVDMPLDEFVLIEEVRPLNYTNYNHQIRVELNDFMVSRFLNRMYYSKMTDLEEEIEAWEEKWTKSGYKHDLSLPRFVLNNYRKWSRDPGFYDKIEYSSYKQTDYETTLLKLYYEETFPDENVQGILDVWRNNRYMRSSEGYYSPIAQRHYSYWEIDRICELISDSRIFRTNTIFENLVDNFTEGDRKKEEPRLYVVLLTRQPELEGYTLVNFSLNWPGYPNYRENGPEYYLTVTDEMTLLRTAMYENLFTLTEEGIRCEYMTENDFEDVEAVRDYMDALHVKAVIRKQILGPDLAKMREQLSEQKLDWSYYLFEYDGTEAYPFETCKKDCSITMDHKIALFSKTEPLKTSFDIPILTHLWAFSIPVEQSYYYEEYKEYGDEYEIIDKEPPEHSVCIEIIYDRHDGAFVYAADALLNKSTPKQMIAAHEETLRDVAERINGQLENARETIKPADRGTMIAEAVEALRPKKVPAIVLEETTQSYNEMSTAASEEAGTSASEENNETTEKDTSGNRWVLPVVAVATGVVVVLAAAGICITRKKKNRGEY
ncbi:MAG: hypothetical protein IK125_09385 [Lachnospiraceae bacterium]|nr:hypothetical protein [Lachnospiraceae bacterium]